MTAYSLTMRADHLEDLSAHLLHEDGFEHAAYLLCNQVSVQHDPWSRQAHRKFLSSRVIPVNNDEVVESNLTSITWRTTSFARVLKEAQAHGQIIAIVHNHPTGMVNFSLQDDENEADLLQMALNRNGSGTRIMSLILTSDGQLSGKIWLHPSSSGHQPLRMIFVVGTTYALHYSRLGQGQISPAYHRQALAFGEALNHDLRMLRVGIVGCGGTGSAVAMLAARLGIGQVVLIDNDIVDQTNLNRLHGARQADADAMRPKVNVVAHTITEMGLGVRVVPLKAWVGDSKCRDVLRICDIIFGCTDDHEGRLFLNRLAYYYLLPVIDLGLAIEVDHNEPPEVKALDGRVTVLGPHHACLLCREVINSEIARAEAMRRTNPDQYEQRKAEAYVAGEGNPSPAVVTFTTELACMAVNEMLHRLQGFRGTTGATANRVRKFHLVHDLRPHHEIRKNCSICASSHIWGRGDVSPFMDRVD